ncbi:MAG TPA: hypothetical protein VNT57_04460, partial [Desulfobacteria bacterium]|nr:hypothetical protein [Desulfobacteria bacterium]
SGLGIIKNNVKYVFNTVNYKKRVSGEWINIRDAVTYLMDGNKKTYLKYKDLTVTKGKNNVYTISIGNVFDKKNQQYFWANGSTWNTPNIYFSVNTKPPVKVTYFLDVNQAVNIVDNGSKVEIKLKNSKYILEVKK